MVRTAARYFACVWLRKRERFAWAQNAYPDELRRHRASLRRDGIVVLGDCMAGANKNSTGN
jgi:hypothetical protein